MNDAFTLFIAYAEICKIIVFPGFPGWPSSCSKSYLNVKLKSDYFKKQAMS